MDAFSVGMVCRQSSSAGGEGESGNGVYGREWGGAARKGVGGEMIKGGIGCEEIAGEGGLRGYGWSDCIGGHGWGEHEVGRLGAVGVCWSSACMGVWCE